MAAAECPLPPPETGHFLEVSFRRLLRECQGIADGIDKSNPEFVNWAESPLFHHYVATLDEQLEELRAVAGQSGSKRGERLDATTREALASQGLAHEALTDELAVLAASLKGNTLAMERKVVDRGRLLDDTETAMDKSIHGVRVAHTGAKTIHRKRRLGFCFTLLALIGIVTAFVGMYVFIKLTSLAGYRAASRAAASTPATTWTAQTEL